MTYVGIDVGTTGCKASVVSRTGDVLECVYHEYDLKFPESGYVTISPDEVWAAVKCALREVIAKSSEQPEAIAIASFGEAVVLIGQDGRPLCDSIFYTDIRGSESLAELRSRVDEADFQYRTGMPINYMYTLPKLMWLQKNAPELLDRTKKILPYGSFVAYMLTGAYASDASLASRTLLYDRIRGCWDDATLKVFGMDASWLPSLVPAGNPVERMLESVASELGISGRPLVVSGVHDQIAAALGAGAIHPGDAEDGIGSAECITAVMPEGIDHAGLFRNNICAEPHAVNGRFVALGFNNTSGASLKWYRDQFETEMKKALKGSGKSVYSVLDEMVTEAPSPLLFLPYLAGSGTPYMDAAAKGMIVGLTLGTAKTDLYRAILEGNSYEMRFNAELLARYGLRFSELTAVGGGASRTALQIKADILQMPIHWIDTSQSGTVGMALLCGKATGQFDSFDEGVKLMVRRAGTVEPSEKYRAEYDDKYRRYRKMYGAMKEILED